MGLHGVLGDEQLLGDGRHGIAPGEQVHDLDLPLRQVVLLADEVAAYGQPIGVLDVVVPRHRRFAVVPLARSVGLARKREEFDIAALLLLRNGQAAGRYITNASIATEMSAMDARGGMLDKTAMLTAFPSR